MAIPGLRMSIERHLLVALIAFYYNCDLILVHAGPAALVQLINPMSMGLFLADGAMNFIDFAKEWKLCPSKPAELHEWDTPDRAAHDWPGMIFFTPDTQEDLEIYYDKNSGGFLDQDIGKFLERGFNKDLPTVMYLHAFTQHPHSRWLETVRQDYIDLLKWSNNQPRINLLFMDFSHFAKLGYAGCARWVPALGKILAQFIDKLVQVSQIDPMQLHLVSFSLGNHICGLAGRLSNSTIGRITALDPAGWCFSERYNHAYTKYGLRATDAYQVDVNHFDKDFLGSRVPVGTIDIYMNGGAAQPGCASGRKALVNAALAVSGLRPGKSYCEGHSRAAVHSVYAVQAECQQIAYECSSYEAFEQGECGQCDATNEQCFSTSIYGIQETWSHRRQAPRSFASHKNMFIKTAAQPPFCVQHYQIVLKLRGHNEPDETKKQSLVNKLSAAFKASQPVLKLYDTEFEEWFVSAPGQIEHEAKELTFTALAIDYNKMSVRDTHSAILTVNKTPYQVTLKKLLDSVESVELNYMSNADYEKRQQHSVTLCPDGIDKQDEGMLWMKKCGVEWQPFAP